MLLLLSLHYTTTIYSNFLPHYYYYYYYLYRRQTWSNKISNAKSFVRKKSNKQKRNLQSIGTLLHTCFCFCFSNLIVRMENGEKEIYRESKNTTLLHLVELTVLIAFRLLYALTTLYWFPCCKNITRKPITYKKKNAPFNTE